MSDLAEKLEELTEFAQALARGEYRDLAERLLSDVSSPRSGLEGGPATPTDNVERLIVALQGLIPAVPPEETQAKNLFRKLVEHVPAISYTCSADGEMTYVSPQVESLLGISADEYCRGFPCLWRSMLYEDEADVDDIRARAFEEGEPFWAEYRLVRSDGKIVWIHDQTALSDDHSLHHGFMLDITARKSAEIRQEEYRQQLRDLSAEITFTEESQRKELAAALHDSVGPMLALGKIKIGMFARASDGDERSTLAESARAILDEAERQIRTLTFQLSPPILYELGLVPALVWLGESFEEKTGIRVAVEESGRERSFSEETKILSYRSTSELLNNVQKHASASRVELMIRCDCDPVEIVVRDNGVGLRERSSGVDHGLGLFSIRERMNRIGGFLELESSNGVTATLRIPATDRSCG